MHFSRKANCQSHIWDSITIKKISLQNFTIVDFSEPAVGYFLPTYSNLAVWSWPAFYQPASPEGAFRQMER